MNKINLNQILGNSSEAIMTGLAGGVGSKLMFDSAVISFGNIPLLNLLDGYDASLLYFIIFNASTMALAYTGDFVAPYLSSSPYFNKINKLSRPLSVGLISLGIMFALSGFSMSLRSASMALALGVGANVAGQFVSDVAFPRRNNPILQYQNAPAPKIEVSMVKDEPIMNNDYNALFGGMSFSDSFAF